jgi:hypothetical protein
VIDIDLSKMVALKEDLYTSAVQLAFGTDGQEALKLLLSAIVHIYRRSDPSLRTKPLVLFTDATVSAPVVPNTTRKVHSISTLTCELDDACLVRVKPDNSLEISPLDITALSKRSESAVVYLYSGGVEKFIINGNEFRLTNPIIGCVSVFCKPTFTSLATALDNYRLRAAAYTSCLILQEAWNETSRWWLRTKPEQTMRKSLVQYLRNVLVDAEVRPEQNVDETHPVDIHVTFSMSDQRAIIEIKWLGKSIDSTGAPATAYSQSRALDGAEQLANYLDSSNTWGPGVRTRGYLVIFDARRKGLAAGTTSLATNDALHYEDKEIEFNPDYSSVRGDFHLPVRMYMYPKTV